MRAAGAVIAVCLGLAGCTAGTTRLEAIAGVPTRDNAVCDVVEVVDGDTVKMACRNGRGGSVRLTGYDTPETFRRGCTAERQLGLQATAYLERRLRTTQVIGVKMQGKDQYDRLLVRMSLDGRDLAQIMISEGLAVPYDGGKRISWCDRLLPS